MWRLLLPDSFPSSDRMVPLDLTAKQISAHLVLQLMSGVTRKNSYQLVPRVSIMRALLLLLQQHPPWGISNKAPAKLERQNGQLCS